jgi:hypothetical protein
MRLVSEPTPSERPVSDTIAGVRRLRAERVNYAAVLYTTLPGAKPRWRFRL